MMIRLMPHMALAALLLATPALADEIDGMHPGLNGFRPGIGNELSTRWEPYVQQRERAAIVNRLSLPGMGPLYRPRSRPRPAEMPRQGGRNNRQRRHNPLELCGVLRCGWR